ncbi:purine or other phosphorylase family 1 (plasmid) [Gemmatirosa kalamazoonensis]|uniref:Purine or other phosphorylase family 1 n=1 Tax=Gemmatirosa kalamazoonensis TaxID=861299 RepID=W0RPA4_9BACT|nr:5'-methylthioadenosine/adenosylhomocysteine nucleosidase [Gemmatirosa kalamazoonensis]AHG92317.1 purine or other phosphorylase family 1 [Gemmatirosa kalamazoonensis]
MLAIMGAMPDEVRHLVDALRDVRTVTRGNRRYHRGTLWGHDVVVVFSHWGKVASAMTATTLVSELGAELLLFTGVAGGVDPTLRVGDVVVATRLVQHDLDARPLFARHEIPLLGRTYLEADPTLRAAVHDAAATFLSEVANAPDTPVATALRAVGVSAPRVVEGLVASGDRFFASDAARAELRRDLPETTCVEMEGAAVAQVCVEHGVPFAVVRTISDAAGDHAAVDFTTFLEAVASTYSHEILRRMLGGGASF